MVSTLTIWHNYWSHSKLNMLSVKNFMVRVSSYIHQRLFIQSIIVFCEALMWFNYVVRGVALNWLDSYYKIWQQFVNFTFRFTERSTVAFQKDLFLTGLRLTSSHLTYIKQVLRFFNPTKGRCLIHASQPMANLFLLWMLKSPFVFDKYTCMTWPTFQYVISQSILLSYIIQLNYSTYLTVLLFRLICADFLSIVSICFIKRGPELFATPLVTTTIYMPFFN